MKFCYDRPSGFRGKNRTIVGRFISPTSRAEIVTINTEISMVFPFQFMHSSE